MDASILRPRATPKPELLPKPSLTVVSIVEAITDSRTREGIAKLLLAAHAACVGQPLPNMTACFTCAQPWCPTRWPVGVLIAERVPFAPPGMVAFCGLCGSCFTDPNRDGMVRVAAERDLQIPPSPAEMRRMGVPSS